LIDQSKILLPTAMTLSAEELFSVVSQPVDICLPALRIHDEAILRFVL